MARQREEHEQNKELVGLVSLGVPLVVADELPASQEEVKKAQLAKARQAMKAGSSEQRLTLTVSQSTIECKQDYAACSH